MGRLKKYLSGGKSRLPSPPPGVRAAKLLISLRIPGQYASLGNTYPWAKKHPLEEILQGVLLRRILAAWRWINYR